MLADEESVVGVFDPFDEEMVRDPHATYARLRAECPVSRGERWGGFWALTGYAEVVAASAAPHTFSSESGVVIPINPLAGRRLPMHFDPPEHTAYRRLLNPAFRPERVAKLVSAVRALADRLLRPLVARGDGELIAEYASPLASLTLSAFLGMSDEFGMRLETHSVAFERAQDAAEARTVEEENATLYAMAREVLHARRATGDPSAEEEPADVVAALLAGRIDGTALTDEEIVGALRQIFIAGHIAVSAALGSAIRHIAGDTDLQASLRTAPDLLPAAVEEFLRLHTPNQGFARTAARDAQVAGRTIRAGEQVALVYTAANRDPAVFADPDGFSLERRPNRHVAFGHGPHKCVGIDLARLEMRIGLEALLTATESITPAGPATPLRWPIHGPATLPIRLRPSSARRAPRA